MRHVKSSALLSGTLCFLAALQLSSGRLIASPKPPAQLGKVSFPTSCSADAQPTIEKAVALLHSFQYKESEQTFSEAAAQDSHCAIAHWGKAMALYHQLWDFPDEKTLNDGRNEIKQAQKLQPATPREQGFVAAATAFYVRDLNLTHVGRIRAYSAVLARMQTQFPGDVEVSSFYALSFVALAEEGDDPAGNRRKTIAILMPLFHQYLDHPGVAHYLIHATDRPELASQGLEAARRYALIAPDSSHALHMPSHIFVRLGLWQDSIASNIAAEAAGARAAELHLAEPHYQTHAMDFLNYSYLQSGQEDKAREVITSTDHIVGASDEEKAEDRAYLSARTALELHSWKEAATLPILPIPRERLDSTYWARAIGSARSGDAAGAQAAVNELTALVTARQKRARRGGYYVSNEKPSDLREAEAWLAFAKGKSAEALHELRGVAIHQDQDGSDSVILPAREMLADMLFELKRPADAFVEYRTVLRNSPNRFNSVLGAARTAQASGDAAIAQSYYTQLTSFCVLAADRPELAEARTILAKR